MDKLAKKMLAEHIYETEATQYELDKLREKMKDSKDMVLAQKMMILKDKMIFHKACLMVLQKLIDETTKEK